MVDMKINRHEARLANTDQRCIVAFMQIPNAEDYSLIIPVDNLQPRFLQAVTSILKSSEGQQEETFAVVLSRHLMPDTGETVFQALHNAGKLVKVPVNNVLMMPFPNQPVKLTHILETWPGGSRLKGPNTQNQQNIAESFSRDKFNPHLNNQQAEVSENKRIMARNLMMEADMLEVDVKKKREAAYSHDPSLRSQNKAASMSPINYGIDLPTRQDIVGPSVISENLFDANSMQGFGNNITDSYTPSNPMEERMAVFEKSLSQILEVVSKLSDNSVQESSPIQDETEN